MKKELVLQVKYGGLGDHLFYSHLPRIAKENCGYQKVFISNSSVMPNPIFRKLVWELNPYVDGFTDDKGVGAPIDLKVREGINLLDAVMLSVGLDDGKRFHEPEVYYKPRKISELEGKNLYVPNYISNAGFLTGQMIGEYFEKQNIHIHYQASVREKRAVPILNFDSYLQTPLFWDFIDAIYSAQDIYTLVTGSATLGPAIGKKINVFYTAEMPKEFRHSRLNNYICLP